MWQRIKQGLETRIGLEDLINTKLKSYSVPRNTNIFYTLGGVALVAFIIQAVSGFFLLVYYVPHSDHAFRSVQYIMTTAPFGWLFRLMHVVGSNLMVAVIFLHMLSVFFNGKLQETKRADLDCRLVNVVCNSHILSQRISSALESVELLDHNRNHCHTCCFPVCR